MVEYCMGANLGTQYHISFSPFPSSSDYMQALKAHITILLIVNAMTIWMINIIHFLALSPVLNYLLLSLKVFYFL